MKMADSKIKGEHLSRRAFLYIRQSTQRQVYENTESTKRQYALRARLVDMGWDESQIETIDSDLGQSGAQSEGRHGFQHLVSEVSLGRAGVIAGIEVSRLSRSSSDWNRLLQIAALSNTLIMDEDGIYNVNDFNDRLLLGLKGTLSEAELHYLQARMRGGALNKAKRGELRIQIPVGYIYDENGQICKDPDMRVQEAIALFFTTFKRVGSAYNVMREYTKQGFLFPNRQFKDYRLGELTWDALTSSNAGRILKNPIYAGIYVYGRTQAHHTVDGRKRKQMPKEEYHAWLPNSHPAYISEAEFEENNLQLAKNTRPNLETGHGGAVREGAALLQGIVICGVCGRKMQVRYKQSDHELKPIYTCDSDYWRYGEAMCQRVAGGNIDITIERLILETINPLTTDAAITVQREMTQRRDEIIRLYSKQMEQARYDMDLAKRRYLRVDPDNRLVAAELERDWNQKAGAYESAKMIYEQKCETEIREIDDKLRLALEQMVSDFPKIWRDPQTSYKEKKRIARLVLEDVTINSDSEKIILGIRFKGGSTKTIDIPKYTRNLNLVDKEMSAVSEIKSLLLSGLANHEIADALNNSGFTYGADDKSFNYWMVGNLIQRHNLPKRTDIARDDTDGWLTPKEKMAELGVSKWELRGMRKRGELVCKEFHLCGPTYLYKPKESGGM
jgi:DNA invertase Pin-like site-specific DNA recombinase